MIVANERIVNRFDSGGATPPLVAVVTLPPGTTASAPAVRADLRTLEQDLARACGPDRRAVERAVLGAGYDLVEIDPTPLRSGALTRGLPLADPGVGT